MSVQQSIATTKQGTTQQLSHNSKDYIKTCLDFDMEHQQKANWCWAATTTSIYNYYQSAAMLTQCNVACKVKGRTDCCNSDPFNACNQPYVLDTPLRMYELLNEMIPRPLCFAEVQYEIKAGNIIGVGVRWHGGGAHFLAIYGSSISAGVQYFNIDDPMYGKSVQSVNNFTNSYRGNGQWSYSYLTKNNKHELGK